MGLYSKESETDIFYKISNLDITVFMGYDNPRILISMAGHKGPKAAQRCISEGQMNTNALCLSVYFKVDKGPTRNGQRA